MAMYEVVNPDMHLGNRKLAVGDRIPGAEFGEGTAEYLASIGALKRLPDTAEKGDTNG